MSAWETDRSRPSPSPPTAAGSRRGGLGGIWLDALAQPAVQPSADVGAPEARTTSDRWTTEDSLGHAIYAEALAELIRNPATEPPLAISIKGEWGSGKTSLMRMVRERLDSRARPPRAPVVPTAPAPPAERKRGIRRVPGDARRPAPDLRRRSPAEAAGGGRADGPLTNRVVLEQLERPPDERNVAAPTAAPTTSGRDDLPTVWFNAWVYQSSEQVWAGLADAIIKGLTERMTPIERERFWATLQLRRLDVDALRRRIYRSFIERLIPKLFWFAGFVVAAVGIWSLRFVFPWPARLTMGAAGASILASAATVAVAAIRSSRKFLDESVAGSAAGLVREPNYADQAGFLHLLHADMDRILELAHVSAERPLVVFVDDLDRCSYTTVAQVIEALNLFLAGQFPNCIFVIGMEPDLVAAQVGVAYRELFGTISATSRAARGSSSAGASSRRWCSCRWRCRHRIPRGSPATSAHSRAQPRRRTATRPGRRPR